jgi:hypothetical protein
VRGTGGCRPAQLGRQGAYFPVWGGGVHDGFACQAIVIE